MNTLKQICRYGIYAGIGLALLAPLLLHNGFFYPFISTRVFIFRLAVEIMLLLYLILNFVADEYRPRFTALSVIIAAFIVIAAISSILGPTPGDSFWGDIERGEGIILWLHLLAFFVILTGMIRTRRAWHALLDYSLGVSLLMSLIALAQALRLPYFLAPSGSRVDATLGNPAFFATYLLFHLAFAVYLFGVRRSVIARIYYVALAGLMVFLLQATQTRGAVVGLAVGVLVGAFLYLILGGSARAKKWSAGVIVAVLVLSGALYLLRQTPVVQKAPGLRRVLNVSLESRTAKTRLVTWQTAWQGFLEKPLLGWGQDNFNIVFNRRFPPYIYASPGSQVWFDRAHNVLLDRAVTTGILGLLAFLAILIYPLYYFLRHHLRDPENRRAAIIFSALLVAYLIQDMFIFESIAVYIVLFFTLGFFASQFLPEVRLVIPRFGRRAILASAIIYAAALGPILWYAVLYPARVNVQAAAAGKSNPQEENFFDIVGRWRKFLDGPWTYGMPEYRLQFVDFVGTQLAPVGEIIPEVRPVLSYTDELAQKQVEDKPYDAKHWLVAARHYNYTHVSLPDKRMERLRKSLQYAEEAVRLSPTRPPAVQEVGYIQLYMYRAARDAKDVALVASALKKAEEYFQKTVDLNPAVYESYTNLVMLYLNSAQTEKVAPVLTAMEKAGVNYRLPERLRDLFNLARNNQNYTWMAFFAEELSKLEPENDQILVDWALSEAFLGHRERAIMVAEKLKKFGEPFVAEADLFISRVRSGYFERPENQPK